MKHNETEKNTKISGLSEGGASSEAMNVLRDYFLSIAQESQSVLADFASENAGNVLAGAMMMVQTLRSGGKILIAGNGGSAADSQHMAAEMVGRLLVERDPLPAIALTTDTSNLTAIGNDYGYEKIFERQIRALAKNNDVFIAISTSGESKNLVLAISAARKIGCKIICLTGTQTSTMAKEADVALCVGKGRNSGRIQESHIFAIHSLVDLVDRIMGNSK